MPKKFIFIPTGRNDLKSQSGNNTFYREYEDLVDLYIGIARVQRNSPDAKIEVYGG